MEPTAAKEFIISRVIEEAAAKKVNLSDVEKKMLYFTEGHSSLPDIYKTNAEFERNYNSDEYEAKVVNLLKSASDRDSRSSPSREEQWKDALDALKREDHYILVMVSQAFGFGSASANEHRVRDFLIYIVVGIGIVLFIVLKTLWKTGH
jgi:hypothetical protein